MRTPALAAIVAFLAFDAALVTWFVMSPRPAEQQQPERVAETPVPPAPAPAASGEPDSAFRRLGPPGPGQWRDAHPDDIAMSFEDYVESGPVRSEERRVGKRCRL